MSWHTGNMTRAAGQLKAILDALLPLNAYWSLYDEPAANKSVYKNNDPARNSLFYWLVDDSAVNAATVELWEGWDAVGHVGVGQRLYLASGGVNTLYIVKSQAGYGVRVRDHNVIFCDMDRKLANYIGQPKRYDESKNMPLLICHNSFSTAPVRNPLGARNNDSGLTSNSSWRLLFDHAGNIRTAIPQHDPSPTTDSTIVNNSSVITRTSAPAGAQLIVETAIFVFGSLLIGTLDGVVYTGVTADAQCMADSETADVDGVVWLMVKAATYGSIIELA